MLDQIRQLEQLSRQLEPDVPERHQWLDALTQYANTFLDEIADAPMYAPVELGPFTEAVKLNEGGAPIDELLTLVNTYIDKMGRNTASGRHLGYIPGGGLFPSAIGDFLAALTNRYTGLYFGNPGAVHLENSLLSWLGEMIGYPATSSGNLASGGSIANLIAVVTARDHFGIEGEAIPKSVIYLTEHAHHCIEKGLHVAGLQKCIKRIVPVDASYRMRPDALEPLIQADQKAGLKAWYVVATSGTTNTGAVDPLAEIGDIAARYGAWFHIDGAYGGLFVLCPEGQAVLGGTEKSDSMVVDPHKTLFLPYGTGAVLVKDRQKHYAAFNAQADYIQSVLEDDEMSPADLSPELTRPFRGLRMWLPLKLFGIAPFRAALSEKIWLARYFHEQIQQVTGFEVGPTPDLSVATYRYIPKRGDADDFNLRLMQAIQHDGRAYISSTRVDGKLILRAAVVSFRTHLHEIDMALDVLKWYSEKLATE